MKRLAVPFLCFIAASAYAQSPIGGGTCGASLLNGTYSLILNGRAISSSGTFAGAFQSVGTATFDGQSKITLSGTANTNLQQGQAFNYAGTYTLASNCSGTATTSLGTATLLVWNNGRNFAFVGANGTYVYSGNGGNLLPAACANSSISGQYVYSTSGSTLLGTVQTGAADESGVLEFDGQGNVTVTYTVYFGGGVQPQQVTTSGKYNVTAGCFVSATLTDNRSVSHTLNFQVASQFGQNLDLIEADAQFLRTGTAHSEFLNPTQSIGNVASYAVNSTPPGSVFVLFGTDLSAREAGAITTTLPTTLLNTSVTVNGEPAPLFYVNTGQIDAQMPWDIPGGAVATVIVKNGNATSNAAAVYVPATGTPGISVYANNRAVVVNQNGTVNSASDAAAVGDEVVAYFTGGGPVQASGKLVSGQPAPPGLSPVTGQNSVTVGNGAARVAYMGLTPGSIGLYQVNFIVPQLAKGTYPVVITIDGQASNAPVMTISN